MEYLPGKKMFVDALSRHPVAAVSPANPDPVQRFPSDGELRKLQDHDPSWVRPSEFILTEFLYPSRQLSQTLWPILPYATMSSLSLIHI